MVSLTTVSAGAVLLAAVFVTTLAEDGGAISCAVGRPGCLVSCRAQNCATGTCHDGGDGIGTCVCSGCDNDPNPLASQKDLLDIPQSRFNILPPPPHQRPWWLHLFHIRPPRPFPAPWNHLPRPFGRSNAPESSLGHLPFVPHPAQGIPDLQEDFFSQNEEPESGEDDVSNDDPDLDDALDSDQDLDDLLDLIPDSSEALMAALGHLPPEDLQNLSEDLESFGELVKSVLQEQQGAGPASDVHQDDERPESYGRRHHHHHHSFWHHFTRFLGTIKTVIDIVKIFH